MKLIIGLGNPGSKYKNNRHNLGFIIIDAYVSKFGLEWAYSRDWICFWAKNENALFIKPSTFMNKSGAAVKAVADFYKVDLKDILVISDEVDLPFSKIRLAFDGLSAGHKGVDSVIQYIGGFEFARLRIGVGSPRRASSEAGSPRRASSEAGRPSHPILDSGSKVKVPDVADYVLEDFSKEERQKLDEVILKCQEALSSYIAEGIEATMNRFN